MQTKWKYKTTIICPFSALFLPFLGKRRKLNSENKKIIYIFWQILSSPSTESAFLPRLQKTKTENVDYQTVIYELISPFKAI